MSFRDTLHRRRADANADPVYNMHSHFIYGTEAEARAGGPDLVRSTIEHEIGRILGGEFTNIIASLIRPEEAGVLQAWADEVDDVNVRNDKLALLILRAEFDAIFDDVLGLLSYTKQSWGPEEDRKWGAHPEGQHAKVIELFEDTINRSIGIFNAITEYEASLYMRQFAASPANMRKYGAVKAGIAPGIQIATGTPNLSDLQIYGETVDMSADVDRFDVALPVTLETFADPSESALERTYVTVTALNDTVHVSYGTNRGQIMKNASFDVKWKHLTAGMTFTEDAVPLPDPPPAEDDTTDDTSDGE